MYLNYDVTTVSKIQSKICLTKLTYYFPSHNTALKKYTTVKFALEI